MTFHSQLLRRYIIVLSATVAMLSIGVDSASAQGSYPDKVVHILVPFPPGGPADALARIVAERFTTSLGRPFVVDNKPGAGGNIGMEQGAKAAPDGYTLTLAP